MVLVHELIHDSERITIRGDKRAARRLTKRMSRMVQAEQQVVAIIQLGEVEYALSGLLVVSDAYMRLYDDVLAAPPPQKLNEEQRVQYMDTVKEQAEVLREKALNYITKGIRYAEHSGWVGASLQALQQREMGILSEMEKEGG